MSGTGGWGSKELLYIYFTHPQRGGIWHSILCWSSTSRFRSHLNSGCGCEQCNASVCRYPSVITCLCFELYSVVLYWWAFHRWKGSPLYRGISHLPYGCLDSHTGTGQPPQQAYLAPWAQCHPSLKIHNYKITKSMYVCIQNCEQNVLFFLFLKQSISTIMVLAYSITCVKCYWYLLAIDKYTLDNCAI